MSKNKNTTRRQFLRSTALLASIPPLLPQFFIGKNKPKLGEEIIGHGAFRYRVHKHWGDLDPARTPVRNCHEMVMDARGRLSLWNAGGEEFLFLCDTTGSVVKTTLDGRELLRLEHPVNYGAYEKEDAFAPTETAIGPNGDIYVADGYGSQYVLQFTAEGEFIRKFGGRGDADDQFQTAHGVCVDARDPGNPSLLVTSRAHNSFKRFSLDGQYLETLFLPGAFVCRPVIDDDMLYSGVCWSRLRYLNQTPDSGFVTILDKDNKVVSNPGGTAPVYENGELQLMLQEQPVFKHCHDVCVDEDKNLYICQWNADSTYPVKLERV